MDLHRTSVRRSGLDPRNASSRRRLLGRQVAMTIVPLQADSLAGPGPSSIAAAAARAGSCCPSGTTRRHRYPAVSTLQPDAVTPTVARAPSSSNILRTLVCAAGAGGAADGPAATVHIPIPTASRRKATVSSRKQQRQQQQQPPPQRERRPEVGQQRQQQQQLPQQQPQSQQPRHQQPQLQKQPQPQPNPNQQQQRQHEQQPSVRPVPSFPSPAHSPPTPVSIFDVVSKSQPFRPRAHPAGVAGPQGPLGDYKRWPDGRQLVEVTTDTTAAAAGSALSHALGAERRAVARFNGGQGGLKGLRVLTLANQYMGAFNRAMSLVVDVRQLYPDAHNPMSDRPQAGDISFAYRVQARSRALEEHEENLPAAMRRSRFLLDMSINVRQAWDQKGEVDEELCYDLADTLYAAVASQQAELDKVEEGRAGEQQEMDGKKQREKRNAGLQEGAERNGVRWQARGREEAGSRGGGGDGEQGSEPAATRGSVELPPYLYITADTAQGLTTFTALALMQRRLRQERQELVVECSIYRASVSAPRFDGRDGWVFAVRLNFERPYLAPGTTSKGW